MSKISSVDHGPELAHVVQHIMSHFNPDGSMNYVEVSGYHQGPASLGRFPNTGYTYHGKPEVGQRSLAEALALDADPVKALRLAWERGDTSEDPARPRRPEPIA